VSDEQPMSGRDLELCTPRPILSRRQRAVVFCVGAVLAAPLSLNGCRADAPQTGDPSPGPEVASEDSSSSSTAPPRTPGVQRLVIPRAVEVMPGTWREIFAVSYGPGVEQLGTSPGGDEGGAVDYGPESGAPAPDGSWWFLDVAKRRLAHYSSSGAFLEGVQVPRPCWCTASSGRFRTCSPTAHSSLSASPAMPGRCSGSVTECWTRFGMRHTC
jgi:hypothetical protein